jgi:aubergine-like protein
MVVGYDVHHKKGSGSTVGLNATLDRNFCRYWSNAHKNGEQQEFSTRLQETLVRALQAFNDTNGVYPKQLLVLRDGVGDQ